MGVCGSAGRNSRTFPGFVVATKILRIMVPFIGTACRLGKKGMHRIQLAAILSQGYHVASRLSYMHVFGRAT